ncbi:MAG: DNA repair protein RadA, partial [Caldilineaceae bacterium]|nr:DNA repair protein RadA [Caldilineaceae bacterium]
RTGNGVDFNRLLLVTAVLSKRMGFSLSAQDIFVNVIGGLRIGEPAADLAIAAAITSSFRNVPVAAEAALIGEIGLSGELRSVSQLPLRLHEAAKLGFARAIVPRHALRRRRAKRDRAEEPCNEAAGFSDMPSDIEVIGARTVADALDAALLK